VSKTQWRQEWLAEPWETSHERALRTLAREYHERTEAFDQTHCRARNRRGKAIPIGAEVRECTTFARQQRADLGRHAAYLGFDARAWDTAIAAEARHFEADWANGMYRDDPRFVTRADASTAQNAT
jgi:hypothetical protein